MEHLKIRNVVVSLCATNCYICFNDKTMDGFVIDPGDSARRIDAAVKQLNVTVRCILLTHGHFDHIGAVNELRQIWNVPVYAGEAERELLSDSSLNLSLEFTGSSVTAAADRYLKDNETFSVCGFNAQVFFTPGHTEGSICFYFPDEGVLFSGDTLFCGSYGRTDFPGGSLSQIISSIKNRLLTLPDETAVCPGHGETTSVGDEKPLWSGVRI